MGCAERTNECSRGSFVAGAEYIGKKKFEMKKARGHFADACFFAS